MRETNHEIRIETWDRSDIDHGIILKFSSSYGHQSLDNFISMLEIGLSNNKSYMGHAIILTTIIRDEVENDDEE